MNDGNDWEHIIDLLILLNADEELIEKIKKENVIQGDIEKDE